MSGFWYQLPSTYLASVLLIITSMLIAGMLVVSFFGSPLGRSKSLAYKAMAILIASWAVLAWKSANCRRTASSPASTRGTLRRLRKELSISSVMTSTWRLAWLYPSW